MIKSESTPQPVLSVTELNQYARGILEMQVGKVAVSGEISNFSQPASGHWYFTLKDSQSQIRCAMFRNKNQFIRLKPNNGLQITLHGGVSIYEGRGEYQLIADYMEETGIGSLQRAFEVLKAKLQQEGLFASEHKQKIPQQLRHIAVITSATGAAIHDILSVLNERFPLLHITLIASAVQGKEAPAQLCQALALAERWNSEEINSIDAIIIGRGGGSIEDLWAFNDETLARAMYDCKIPIISAVGHEVDVTIADYVADLRAPTPSAAAEMISPDQHAIYQSLDHYEQRLSNKITTLLHQFQRQLLLLEKSLHHPGEKLAQLRSRFDQFEEKLEKSVSRLIEKKQHRLHLSSQSLMQANPHTQIHSSAAKLQQLSDTLEKSIQRKIERAGQQLVASSALLNSLNPLSTLERGYAIVKDKEGRIISNANTQQVGDSIYTRLAEGELHCTINKIHS